MPEVPLPLLVWRFFLCCLAAVGEVRDNATAGLYTKTSRR